jgi:hypothetical protein
MKKNKYHHGADIVKEVLSKLDSAMPRAGAVPAPTISPPCCL